jgi:alanine-glyoxylate transaminase / serine-glyoxylate transaminase / serine-pyruvate transaminase
MFGERMADAMTRRGADVIRVDGEWGRAIPTEQLLDATREPFAALFVVHGETSTGVAQPLDALAEACAQHGALLLIDCVTSLAGHPLDLDAAGVDAAFSGSQKCLNCPAGLAPFTANERALERVQGSPSWFFDLTAVMGYWQAESARAYHHTAPTNMVVALREALRIVQEEGLEPRWARHEKAHEALRRALAELGFERIAPDGEHLYPLLAMRLPEGVDDAPTRRALLTEHGIEVAAASGPFAGQAWRIGVMGEGARPTAQERLVRAIARELDIDATIALDALHDGWA